MEQYRLFAYVAVLLFAAGFYAVMATPHLLRKIIALNVMASGAFLLLISIASRRPAPFPDPVPHAMVLTGIVVGVSVSALAMVLARRIHRESGASTLYRAEHAPQDEERRE
jgi:multicomponent Na+:H+ antiporter subunit C